MAWAIKQKVGNTTAKFVLLMVANYADEQGRAWPSQERLAEGIEASRHTVMRALDFLEQEGFLTRVRRHREDGSRMADVIHLGLCSNLQRSKNSEPKSQSATAEPITEPIRKGKDAGARGSRLHEDWTPSKEGWDRAVERIGLKGTEVELEKFRNYWLSKAGRDAVKLNWERTFSNWIINASERTNHVRPSVSGTNGAQRSDAPGNLARIFDKINAAIDAVEDGSEGSGGHFAGLPAGRH